MKPLKLEPYHRSRHRAALHAWVVAATAVASIGMPSAALAMDFDETRQTAAHDDLTPSQAAHRVATDWLLALSSGDIESAMQLMALPKAHAGERAVGQQAEALSDWLSHSGAKPTPVAHRHAGHWALSAWRLDAGDNSVGCLLEPITLYHAASDGLFDHADDWRIVPQGYATDPALAPLYNADHTELMQWYQTLV